MKRMEPENQHGNYADFLVAKAPHVQSHGKVVNVRSINKSLFPFQRALVQWAARRGRGAIFADCGLGKTPMQLEWARLVAKRSLIVAPLCVSVQTIREGEKFGVPVHDLRSDWTPRDGVNIVNYEMLDHVRAADFDAVVLDESSILKSFDGATRNLLVEMFRDTPFRLACTATPAPNDMDEIGNHAEFLGIMREVEMRATWFVHDGQEWRLKGHAKRDFYRWMASWAMFLGTPSDLGFDDDGYKLPPLDIVAEFVTVPITSAGSLFFTGIGGVTDRAVIRSSTIDARVARCAAVVNASPDQWIVWCGLNEESERAAEAIDGAVEVTGSDSVKEKENAIMGFINGDIRVLVTKPKIAGFGMNFQHCASMAFLGLSDSYESYYQAIRRCYRFGQTRPVRCVIVLADVEHEILLNVQRKERDALALARAIIAEVREYERMEVGMAEEKKDDYAEAEWSGDKWRLLRGDCIEALRTRIEPDSVDLSVFSPPFSSLFTYSNSERDIGNCRGEAEFFAHFKFFVEGLLRVLKPGRIAAVHVANIPAMLSRDGYIGIKDFRGSVIRCMETGGLIFHGEVCIDKDPQAQAIRTKSKGLLFVQLRKDSSWSRPALADYILLFRKPGENAVPVNPDDISNNDWIEWARPIWYGIRETDTLNAREAREEEDERHICPLQLGTIERCVRLWSNPGETVLSPFAGIGSEGYQAILSGRRFVGVELKESYAAAARKNLAAAETKSTESTLFVTR